MFRPNLALAVLLAGSCLMWACKEEKSTETPPEGISGIAAPTVPTELVQAQSLISKRLCSEAVPVLKKALPEHADDVRFYRALCQASLCSCFDPERAGPGEQCGAPEVMKYCKEGAADKDPSGTLLYALALEMSGAKEAAYTLLSSESERTKDDSLRWFARYQFLTGERVESPNADSAQSPSQIHGVPLQLGAMGNVVVSVGGCLTKPDAGTQFLVRRAGAPVSVPGQSAVESHLEPGTILDTISVRGNEIVFEDTKSVHWKPGSGWRLAQVQARDLACFSDHYADSRRQILLNNCNKLRAEINVTRDGSFQGVDIPLDENLVFRNVPATSKWDAVYSGGNCRAVKSVSCEVSGSEKIEVRPGSVRDTDATEEVAESGTDCNRLYSRSIYRKVEFEERAAPERAVPLANVWAIDGSCEGGNLARADAEYPEWDEAILDEAFSGKLRQGLPEGLLVAMGYRLTALYFDQGKLMLAWGKGRGTAGEPEIVTGNGRVVN